VASCPTHEHEGCQSPSREISSTTAANRQEPSQNLQSVNNRKIAKSATSQQSQNREISRFDFAREIGARSTPNQKSQIANHQAITNQESKI
jgi:hypothetical protein